MVIVLGSEVNIIGREGPGGPFNEHENLRFDVEQVIHMSSRNHEESGYGFDLDLLTILYKQCISFSKGSKLVEKCTD